MELDPQIGDISDLDNLVKAARERDQHLILELDPNHSSMKHSWFEQSVNNKNPYTDYYIWADGQTTSDGERHPPNNWVYLKYSCNHLNAIGTYEYFANTFFFIYIYI